MKQQTRIAVIGGLGFTALLRWPERFKGKKVGLLLAGGNIDPRMLASVLNREMVREGRMVTFRILGDDRPGVLAAMSAAIAGCGGNILDVVHNRLALAWSHQLNDPAILRVLTPQPLRRPSDPPPAAMQDPSLASSIFFPPSLVNAEAADTGAALASGKAKISVRASRCSPINPCAMPPPARDHVTLPRAN